MLGGVIKDQEEPSTQAVVEKDFPANYYLSYAPQLMRSDKLLVFFRGYKLSLKPLMMMRKPRLIRVGFKTYINHFRGIFQKVVVSDRN